MESNTPLDIKGLYLKGGYWYLRQPQVAGKRPPAIAMKTKDRGEAVEQAFNLFNKKVLRVVQTRDRMEDLLAEYLAAQRSARVHTLRTSDITRRVLGKLAKDWGNPKVADIDRKKVVAWRAELNLRPGYGWVDADHAVGADGKVKKPTMSEASISSYLLRLRGFVSWLVEERHLRENPMELIKLPRVKKTKREKFCTVEQREALLSDPPTDEIDFILHFGFFAGLRFGEMLAMQADWLVKLGDGKWLLTVKETSFWKPKDKETRTIEVHPRLAAFIEGYGLKRPFMLAPKKKEWRVEPAYRFNPKKAFATHAKNHGVEFCTYHTLRHSLATHLASAGMSMIEIARILGDTPRVVESNYASFAPTGVSKLATI
jgi:integrase/recombinase XerD